MCIFICDWLKFNSNLECYIVLFEFIKMWDIVLKDCINIFNNLGIVYKVSGVDFG